MRLGQSAALIAMLSSGACASTSSVPVSEHRIEGPSNYTVFWDLPFRDWYWVPTGTQARAIRDAAQACGAEVDGAMSHHVPVPPAFDWGVFRFVGEPSETSRACVIERVQAVRALTVYPRRS
mgnify:CR=1 FL=1